MLTVKMAKLHVFLIIVITYTIQCKIISFFTKNKRNNFISSGSLADSEDKWHFANLLKSLAGYNIFFGTPLYFPSYDDPGTMYQIFDEKYIWGVSYKYTLSVPTSFKSNKHAR